MTNNNIFREAKELLNTKPIEEMTQEELLMVKTAFMPLTLLPQFNDMTTDQGLEYLSRLFEEETMVLKKDCQGCHDPSVRLSLYRGHMLCGSCITRWRGLEKRVGREMPWKEFLDPSPRILYEGK